MTHARRFVSGDLSVMMAVHLVSCEVALQQIRPCCTRGSEIAVS